MKYAALLTIALLTFSCQQEVSKEYRTLVKGVDYKVRNIDHNHRVTILEDDFIMGDSTFKVRGYYMEGILEKLVGITRTPHFERDDYFYFDNGKTIFSGHMMNFRDEKLAEEFKYYYDGGQVVECLFWEDHYVPGKRFPHETFEEFYPNMDSLMKEEKYRLGFFMEMINTKGFTIKEENDNLSNF
jgi:hypothetical protein